MYLKNKYKYFINISFNYLFIFILLYVFISKPYALETNTYKKQLYVNGEILVSYINSLKGANFKKTYLSNNMKLLKNFKSVNIDLITVPESISIEDALKLLNADPNVLFAEPNYLRYAETSIPNDTYFENLWGLYNINQYPNSIAGADINALEAWNYTTGSNDIIVAIIDSGVDVNHPDLKTNIWINKDEIPENNIDDDNNGFTDDINGWNFIQKNNDLTDIFNHGTFIAGVIGGTGNNYTGVTGICWNTSLMVLKIMDGFGIGSVANEISAINYAIENGAKIINASFGDFNYSQSEYNAIEKAKNAGILFIAAAGNNKKDNNRFPHYPSGYELANIISVAASTPKDTLASFSNYGSTVDVAAPGVYIYSSSASKETIFFDDFEQTNDNWELESNWHIDKSVQSISATSLTNSSNLGENSKLNISAISRKIFLNQQTGCLLTFSIKGNSPISSKLFIETSTSLTGQWHIQKVLINSTDLFSSGIYGKYNNSVTALADLSDIDGNYYFYLRIRFETLSFNIESKWYIDDIKILTADTKYENSDNSHYGLVSGTSIAAPYVSGIAALILSYYPDLNYTQVKERIINGIDETPALKGQVNSNGRVNAYKSLTTSENISSESNSAESSDSGGGGCFISSVTDSLTKKKPNTFFQNISLYLSKLMPLQLRK